MVEFYAPWCGHCQNLKPAYEKAATALSGIARLAAVNCDEDENKAFCGSMGVQGFPTLKIVKPGRSKDGKKAKPVVEDYQGARTAKGINDAVVDKVVNHVTKLKDDGIEAWVQKESSRPKAVFFSEKGIVSPLIKAVAIDFLGSVDVGFMRSAETAAVEKYDVKSFPTIVLLQEGKEPMLYNGEMKKAALVEFISQAAAPNPDADPAKQQQHEKPKPSKNKKAGDPLGAPTKIPKASSSSSSAASSKEPTESSSSPDGSSPPGDAAKPAAMIPSLSSESDLQKSCLHTKSATCILAILPGEMSNLDTNPAVSALNEVSHKHKSRGANIFPFYIVPSASNNLAQYLMTMLLAQSPPASGGDGQVTLLAINAKKGWWTRFERGEHTARGIEDWIEDIRFGDHSKTKLPEGLVQEIQQDEIPKKERKVETPVEEDDDKPIEISMEQMQGAPSGEFANGLKWEWVEVDEDYVPEQDRVKDEL